MTGCAGLIERAAQCWSATKSAFTFANLSLRKDPAHHLIQSTIEFATLRLQEQCTHPVALNPRTNGRCLPSMQICRRSSMNTEVDGCEGAEARVTLVTPFGRSSRRSNLPNHPRREFGLNLNQPPCPILSFGDMKHRQYAHDPHPQHRIRNPLAWAVSPSEPKGHARREGVTVYDSPIFTEVPLRAKDVGIGVFALLMMNLPTEKQLCQSCLSESRSSLTRHWARSSYLQRIRIKHYRSSRATHPLE